MHGIVTPEVSEYMKAIIDGTVDVNPIEFIRCVDDRAFLTLKEIAAALSARVAGDLQLTLTSSNTTISDSVIQEQIAAANRQVQAGLAYGWLLNHLSRLVIDLKKVPDLQLYISAVIDSEGDLKKLKENLTAAKKPKTVDPEEKSFNDLMNAVRNM